MAWGASENRYGGICQVNKEEMQVKGWDMVTDVEVES
jgi:hypothetical protein